MSGSEEEFEVDFIQKARVQGQSGNKQWFYYVKWKNYSNKHNTWEPTESFVGSEHFIEDFWEKVRDKRDWHDISLFDHGEMMMPTGPPRRTNKSIAKTDSVPKPSSKGRPAAAASSSRQKPESKKEPALSAAKGARKRRFEELEELEVEENPEGASENEVRSIIEEPAPRKRGRPRRRLDEPEPPAASNARNGRAKSGQPRKNDDDDEVVEISPPAKTRKITTARPANLPSRSRKAKEVEAEEVEQNERSSRIRKTASSKVGPPVSARRRASGSPNKRPRRQKAIAAEKDSSPDVILLGDNATVPDGPAPVLSLLSKPSKDSATKDPDTGPTAMQVDYPDTGAEADVEDEAMQVEPAPADDDVLEVPSSDILEQQLTIGPEEAEQRIEHVKAVPQSPQLPAHRARTANPRVKMMDDDIRDDGPRGISTKARISRRVSNNNAESGPSSSTPAKSAGKSNGTSSSKKKGSKPGPGRSSSGLQLSMGSTSLLTVVKKGALQTLRKLNPYSRASANDDEDESVPVTEAEPEMPVTAEQLLKMGGFDAEEAGELPDYEDADAEGDLDPDVHGHGHARSGKAAESKAKAKAKEGAQTEIHVDESAYTADNADSAAVEESAEKENAHDAQGPEVDVEALVVTATGRIVNPPNAAIGRKPSVADLAAWKQTTIFGPLGIGRDGPVSPTLPGVDAPLLQAASADHGFSVVLTSAKHLPVVLKDVTAPKSTSLQPLSAIANANADPPGCFYKAQHADALLDAFRTEGSCARAVKDDTMDTTQKNDFEQFASRLKDGELYLATINSHTLAFCASENTSMATKLGVSPNLVGLGDNVLVAEVEISDDAVYCDAVMNVEPGGW